jgi:hypothetical protein
MVIFHSYVSFQQGNHIPLILNPPHSPWFRRGMGHHMGLISQTLGGTVKETGNKQIPARLVGSR